MKKKQVKGYWKWIFTNKLYYILAIGWLVLSFMSDYENTISSLPENISFPFLIGLAISLIVYMLIWQAPFAIYWLIKSRKRK